MKSILNYSVKIIRIIKIKLTICKMSTLKARAILLAIALVGLENLLKLGVILKKPFKSKKIKKTFIHTLTIA